MTSDTNLTAHFMHVVEGTWSDPKKIEIYSPKTGERVITGVVDQPLERVGEGVDENGHHYVDLRIRGTRVDD
jgi:hypothetical protein